MPWLLPNAMAEERFNGRGQDARTKNGREQDARTKFTGTLTGASAPITKATTKAISKKTITCEERWVSSLDANLRRYIHFEISPNPLSQRTVATNRRNEPAQRNKRHKMNAIKWRIKGTRLEESNNVDVITTGIT